MSHDNLLLLASLYAHKAESFLKKISQPAPMPGVVLLESLPNNLKRLLDPNNDISRFLSAFTNKHQSMIDWVYKNQTVLNQYNVRWGYSGGGDLYMTCWDGNHYYRLQASPIPPYSQPEKWETVAFLVGSGAIPPMKIYSKSEDIGDLPAKVFSKETGHYGFITQILDKLLYINDYELVEKTKEFVKDNKDLLIKIRSQFQTEPRVLGAGVDGLAFSIGPDRVLKFFKSKYAYDSALKAVNRLFKTPESAGTEAMIYDHGEFKEINGVVLYYYIIEKMAPLDKLVDDDIANDFLRIIKIQANEMVKYNKWIIKLQDPVNVSTVAKEIKIGAKHIQEYFIKDEPGILKNMNNEIPNLEYKMREYFPELKEPFKLNPNWLIKLIEEILWKLSTERTDLHSGNIGVTSFGDLRYFDPAYNNR